jgi:hypothetical protein
MAIKKEKIITWLLERPGYFKKSAGAVYEISPYNLVPFGTIDKFEKVFYEAKRRYKENSKPTLTNIQKKVNKNFNTIDEDKRAGKPVNIITQTLNKNRNTPGTYYITGCAHVPWHNKAMYNSVFTYLTKEVELQGLILAGDIADINSLSSHDKGKISLPGVNLEWEYKQVNKFLDEIDDLNIKGSKDFIFGNHEDRYNRITKDVDIAKYGSALKSPTEGLRLLERGYNVFDNWKNDCISLGPHLDINHGEFLNVHSAKKTIDTYRKSIMYFHTHRFQIYIEGLVGGFNMGSGADFNAPVFNYATRAMKNSWINSSCLVTLDNDGFYHVQPLMWINNQLVINGKKY